VVILAAGQGTRMRSGTPKLLHPLCGRLMIGWPVAAATKAGAGRIVVVDAPGERLRPELGDDIAIAIQEQPRGTGDAVKAAQEHFSAGDTVVVLNGDVPLIAPETIEALVAARESTGAAATIVTAVLEDPSGYGRVVRGADGTVLRVVETKTTGDATEEEWAIQEVNAGIYAFDSALLADALAQVTSDNSQGEYYLPDVLAILRDGGGTVTALELADTGEILQINDRRQLAEVRAEAQRRINDAHMLAGVTIVDPAATVIDVGVTLAQDAVIAPFTSLHGTTTVGSGSTIGPNSTLIDTRVGEGAKVLHSYVTDATIEDRVSVGPFAYLRPGAILREGSKAGTFVEIKNSEVGPGSKVPHLSYIGDATIGPGTNIGAATITANYDGYNKHRTTIGAGVRTGVDTTLVAPVTVGDEAYTAAGSVIGQDVPPGALAGSPGVARKAQHNVEGYAERRKADADKKKSDAASKTAAADNANHAKERQ
jgi:bifunctional UDP-N-acetylglucosamine pyrophosphorylase / glucosamine-1-phosphate N-acetyltransferase